MVFLHSNSGALPAHLHTCIFQFHQGAKGSEHGNCFPNFNLTTILWGRRGCEAGVGLPCLVASDRIRRDRWLITAVKNTTPHTSLLPSPLTPEWFPTGNVALLVSNDTDREMSNTVMPHQPIHFIGHYGRGLVMVRACTVAVPSLMPCLDSHQDPEHNLPSLTFLPHWLFWERVSLLILLVLIAF